MEASIWRRCSVSSPLPPRLPPGVLRRTSHLLAVLRLNSSPFPFLGGIALVSLPPPSLASSSSAAAGGAPLIRVRCSAVPALLQDGVATALVMGGGYSLVRAFDALTHRNLIEQSLSRKLVHVLSGILFMSSWPIFSTSMEARYFAAIVPLANFIRLTTYGLQIFVDEGLIKSITREGKPEELLRGPLYYVVVLMFCVLVFWRDSPVGIVSLAMMSGGDGFADIVGRRYGTVKLPYNKHKSWIGSISMFISGFLFSVGMLYYYSALGYIHLDWQKTIERVTLISLAATAVESLPINEVIDDNISVPLTSMLTAFLVFG